MIEIKLRKRSLLARYWYTINHYHKYPATNNLGLWFNLKLVYQAHKLETLSQTKTEKDKI